jgi:CRISPR/Cas system-associated exonuclease Cas4 (RecB family)
MSSNPFLKDIAAILLQPDAYDLPNTCVVFPNKRARLYLSKYIGELTEKPVWAPQYLTITELMEKISGYLFIDQLSLLFETYTIYSKITGSTESFDAFYPYSETLLADFDEIDKYLIDANDLFGNLSGLKSIDGRFNYLTDEQILIIQRFWNTFDPERISKGQEVFISLWDALPQVYHQLRSSLNDREMAYEGMAYRKATEIIESKEIPDVITCKKYVFIGFNALNKCEEKLFRYLKNLNRAEFFWDYDSWYTNNDIHEAGFFMRKNIRNFPQSKPINHENIINNKYNNVLFIPVASNSGQTGILPDVFSKFDLKGTKEIENTAVVLADENLLIPALYAIPEYITDVNITMGYPLAGSAILNLIDSLYELHRNSRKGNDGRISWYFRDVLAILDSPVLKIFYAGYIEAVRQKVVAESLIFLDQTDILPDKPTDDLIFNDRLQEDPCRLMLEIITGIIRQLSSGEEEQVSPDHVQVEILFQVYTFLTRLQDILIQQDYVPGNDILFRLIRKMLKHMHIPFNGEPLAGIQVLGILETRTIDFKNIILLSANEGILPKPADIPSFIPYNLRAGFGMPTPEHQDAIYAYYFYRMIQRAQNVALIYDSSSGGMRSGERSRFLHQLIYETKLPVTEINFESSIALIPVKPIYIEKNGAVRSTLEKYLTGDGKLLSPSAINEFLNCPLRFYFRHIAGLPQPEEVAEEIDARVFGSLFHSALNHIYAGFGQPVITASMLEVALKEEMIINTALDKAFNEVIFGAKQGESDRKPEGFNLIVRQVIYTYIRQFLTKELLTCPFILVSLETKYATRIPVVANGESLSLSVGGIIDRIDNRNGKVRIIDYKTGSLKNAFVSVESLFDAGDKLRNDAAFQVLLYAYVYERLYPGNDIEPGLFFLRNSHAYDFSHSIYYGAKKEALSSYSMIKKDFEELLQLHLVRLFDYAEPFRQTNNLQTCRFCPYAAICRRESNETI